jgi:hypothetical protein
MSEDQRCCGTGTCLINADGLCWCGQKWIGDKLVGPEPLADYKTHRRTNQISHLIDEKTLF